MITNDEPIEQPDDDVLGRGPLAREIAHHLRTLDTSRGAVIGLLGPWGSGKTSLLNLIRHELTASPQLTVLDFNPWFFSGTDQLIERFFVELAAQLRLQPARLHQLARYVADYGDAVAPLQLLPVVGSWFERVGKAGEALRKRHERQALGISENRKRLSAALATLEHPIVVVIDDVDRLSTSEIRDIFKLVRLTGNFPNVIYLVAFDRARVEQALDEDRLPGRDYLEKIIQMTFDLPAIPSTLLQYQLTGAIDHALASIENVGPWEPDRWPDVFAEIVWPITDNMRDVRRYAATLTSTVRGLDGRVALVDVLALEAIRIFCPDLFTAIGQTVEPLTSPSQGSDWDQRHDPLLAAAIEALVAASGEQQLIAGAMMRRLFPAALRHTDNYSYGVESVRDWMRARRVAHAEILRFYIQRVAGSDLEAFWGAERVFAVLGDRTAMEEYFRTLDPSAWESTIQALEYYQDVFPPEAVRSATTVLLNLMGEIPERPRTMYDVDARMVVRRVVLRLLRAMPTPEQTEAVVRAVLPDLATFGAKLTLIEVVGHDEHAGHGLVDETVSGAIEATLRAEVRRAPVERLTSEPDLYGLFQWIRRTSTPSEPRFEVPVDCAIGLALLKAARSDVHRRGLETRATHRERVLFWDSLVELMGGEEILAWYVNACEADTDDPGLAEAIALARRYLEEWRPEHVSRSRS